MKYLSAVLVLLNCTMLLTDYATASEEIHVARKLNVRGANRVIRLDEVNFDSRSLRGKGGKKNDKKQEKESRDTDSEDGLVLTDIHYGNSDLSATHVEIEDNVVVGRPIDETQESEQPITPSTDSETDQENNLGETHIDLRDIVSPSDPVSPLPEESESGGEDENTNVFLAVPSFDGVPPVSEAQSPCAEGLFHYRKVDRETLQVVFDYYLDVNNGHCVVIDRRCPSFYDEDKITYSSCAPECLYPDAKNPC